MVKKYLMKQLWRIQQSQAIISIIFWSLTLTGIFYGYAKWYMERYLGIPDSKVLTGMLALFVMVFISILLIGFLFDKLRFWKEQQIVAVERNPYTTTRIFPKEILQYKHFNIPMLRAMNKNEDADFFENWIKKALEEDKELREEFERSEKWIKGK